MEAANLVVYFQGSRGPNGTLGEIGKPGPEVSEQIRGNCFTLTNSTNYNMVFSLNSSTL